LHCLKDIITIAEDNLVLLKITMPDKFKNATTRGHFGLAFEENFFRNLSRRFQIPPVL